MSIAAPDVGAHVLKRSQPHEVLSDVRKPEDKARATSLAISHT